MRVLEQAENGIIDSFTVGLKELVVKLDDTYLKNYIKKLFKSGDTMAIIVYTQVCLQGDADCFDQPLFQTK